LIVTVLGARVLAVADNQQPLFHVDVRPVGPADLLLPHRCRNGVPNDAAHWDKLSTIGFEVLNELIKFILGWSSVSLSRFPNKTQVL
jgi:hypothetical protein